MGKQNSGEGFRRREPYNQPIKIYGVVVATPGEDQMKVPRKGIRSGFRRKGTGESIDVRVGRKITSTRERRGLTLAQLANKSKVPVELLKEIEAGKGKLTIRQLMRIVAALDCILSVEIV
jgi:ribosome-binding protein aMBF1 (putative translation factor)